MYCIIVCLGLQYYCAMVKYSMPSLRMAFEDSSSLSSGVSTHFREALTRALRYCLIFLVPIFFLSIGPGVCACINRQHIPSRVAALVYCTSTWIRNQSPREILHIENIFFLILHTTKNKNYFWRKEYPVVLIALSRYLNYFDITLLYDHVLQ